MTKPPLLLMVPAMTLAPTSFVTGIDSPVTKDSSERRAAFGQLAVDRHLLAGPHAQQIANHYAFERHVALFSSTPMAMRDLRREIEQCADRARGLLARAQFQNLAEQHQYGDDGACFE